MRIRSLKLLPLLVIALVAACSNSNREPTSGLSNLVLSSPGGGFPTQLTIDQRLDLSTASEATPDDPATVADYLQKDGYRDGYQRTWTQGQTFVTLLVFSM